LKSIPPIRGVRVLDEKFLDELNELDPGGVLAYTPLLTRLEQCEDNVDRRREVAIRSLPMALLCALQDEKCLQDIIDVSEKFPDLLPEIYGVATGLRESKGFKDWTKYESANYKDFITGIENRLMGGGLI